LVPPCYSPGISPCLLLRFTWKRLFFSPPSSLFTTIFRCPPGRDWSGPVLRLYLLLVWWRVFFCQSPTLSARHHRPTLSFHIPSFVFAVRVPPTYSSFQFRILLPFRERPGITCFFRLIFGVFFPLFFLVSPFGDSLSLGATRPFERLSASRPLACWVPPLPPLASVVLIW